MILTDGFQPLSCMGSSHQKGLQTPVSNAEVSDLCLQRACRYTAEAKHSAVWGLENRHTLLVDYLLTVDFCLFYKNTEKKIPH